jgi:hypothetical protein
MSEQRKARYIPEAIVQILLYTVIMCTALHISCSLDPFAGSGTEEGNVVSGVIIDTSGNTVSQAIVTLIPYNYNPVTDDPIPNSFKGTTNQYGEYLITVSGTGTFNIQAVHNSQGTRLLVTGVTVQADTTVVPTATLKDPGFIKLFLPDTIDTANGYVFVEGTTLLKSLSHVTPLPDGGYSLVLDQVPAALISGFQYDKPDDPDAPLRISDTLTVPSNDTTAAEAFVFWANYTKENTPLPGNAVNDISNSPTTFVFATSGGIAELPPSKYWIIHTADDMGVTSDNILSVCYIQYGIMWIATSGGAAELDGSTWISYTTANSGIPTDLITDVAIDGIGYGNVWLGTRDKGLLKFDGNRAWTAYDTSNSDIPSNGVLSVLVDRGDTVWCTTQNGVFKLKDSYSKALTPLNSGIPSGDIYCMAIDNNRDKWFGYHGGVARYSEGNNIWTQYTSVHSVIISDSVLTIAEDEDGSMLFGTPGGMTRFDGTQWIDYTGSKYQMLANKGVRSIVVDNSGDKWIGTANNGVIIFGPTVK